MTKYWTLPLNLQPAGGPYDDPALLATLPNRETALLFDCGSLHGHKTRDLQKVRWVFLTHLHIDHLIGFDQLLRVRLFSPLPLTVYGPPGTVRALTHRLQGYAWNLTSGSPFVIRVFDLGSPPEVGREMACHHRFRPRRCSDSAWVDLPDAQGRVELEPGTVVDCMEVDHGVPCLAFRLERRSAPKFSLETAQRLGLRPGPWTGELIAGLPVELEVQGQRRQAPWLRQHLLAPPACHRFGFLTDTRLPAPLLERLAAFYQGADALCSEAAYLDEERDSAALHGHMTTHQVAELALRSGLQRLLIFHLSRRHREQGPARHLQEIGALFPEVELLGPRRWGQDPPSP